MRQLGRSSASDIISFTTQTSGEFDMGDWDGVVIHFRSSVSDDLWLEETLDGGTTWIQSASPTHGAGVDVRFAWGALYGIDSFKRPHAGRVRFRYLTGSPTYTRIQKRRYLA